MPLHTEERNGFRLLIEPDSDPMSPRDAETSGLLLIPDAIVDQDHRKDEHRAAIRQWVRFREHFGNGSPAAFRAFSLWAREEFGARVVLPVYYGTHGPQCSVTVGEVTDNGNGAQGVTFTTAQSVRNGWADYPVTDEALAAILAGEAEEWARWANGDAYCFTVDRITVCDGCGREETETVESVSSLIGWEYARAEALDALRMHADGPAEPAAGSAD